MNNKPLITYSKGKTNSYMCYNCFDILKEATTCKCGCQSIFPIDLNIAKFIQLLNRNNIKTYWSCGGHPDTNDNIFFTIEINDITKYLIDILECELASIRNVKTNIETISHVNELRANDTLIGIDKPVIMMNIIIDSTLARFDLEKYYDTSIEVFNILEEETKRHILR